MLAHLHNMVVHFPIAFAFVALLLTLWTLRKPDRILELRTVLILAAIAAVIAYFSGERQEEAAEARGVAESLLDLHETLGTWTMILFVAGGVLAVLESFVAPLRRLLLVVPILLVGMVSWTGYVGGQVAHGTAVVQAGEGGETEMESGEGEEGEGGLRALLPGGEHEEEDDD
jgi:uncharacterized membrane protein